MSNEADPAAAGEIAASLRTFAARALVYNLLASEELGLAPADLVCMCLLQLHGPAMPGWIAEMTGLSTGAVTGVVDRLERAGYVTRARDPQDRRRVIVGPDLERFDHDLQRHAPTPPPATLEFLREYPAAQLRAIRRFTADLAAGSAPAQPPGGSQPAGALPQGIPPGICPAGQEKAPAPKGRAAVIAAGPEPPSGSPAHIAGEPPSPG